MDVPRFDLILSEESNVPLHETAERLARALAAVEADVEIVTGQVARAGRTPLVVDPHVAFAAYPDDQLDAALRGAVCVLTPSPNDPLFLNAVACARASSAVLHVSDYGLRGLAEHLVEAARLPLGHDPALDRWGGEERPRDVRVAFYGTRTRRREAMLAACADLAWPHECEWHMLEPPLDADATRRGYLAAAERADLLARTDVLLCLRSGGDPSLSWLRLADGLTNGAVLLCERSVGTAPLRPGHELLMTSEQSLPVMLERLLADADLRERVRRAGYEVARGSLSQRATGTALLNAALRAAGASERRQLSRAARVGPEPADDPVDHLDDAQRGVAHRIARETRRRREVEAQLAALQGRQTTRVDTPAWDRASPRVTALVSLYDYADVIERTLDSLAASEGVALEIIVVDDASQDDGPAVVAGWIERHPNVPARLLALPANAGVAYARNVGAAEARGELIFVMDADNTVFPNGLARLVEALDANPAAGYAYGITDRRSPEGPIALLSHLETNGARLYRSNDIDAMALVRASTVAAVGGFSDDGLLLLGSQDWDFWLACADHGLDGMLVRQPVATYHEGHASMTGTYAALRGALHEAIRGRHPGLAPAAPPEPRELTIAGAATDGTETGVPEPPADPERPATPRAPDERPRVAILCSDMLGVSMAGPAIRAVEIARALGEEFECVIAAREVDPRARTPCPAIALGEDALGELLPGCAAAILQGPLTHWHPSVLRSQTPLVVDLYDPLNLEALEGAEAWANVPYTLDILHDQLMRGDFFVCASERQRDYWLGMLAAEGRISPDAYADDPDLLALIDVVPFGIPREAPERTGPGVRGVAPGIGPDDPLFVWNGGLWGWFDPQLFVRAVDLARREVPELRAWFMGVRRPGESELPPPARDTVALARRLGIEGTHVFFNDWTPFDERQNTYLEATAAVSLHRAHVETRFSFRTRLLDCIWAGVPVLATEGDVLATLVLEEGLGLTAPPDDVEAVAAALVRLARDPELQASARARLLDLSPAYTWDVAVEPLRRFLRAPRRGARPIPVAGLDEQLRGLPVRPTGPLPGRGQRAKELVPTPLRKHVLGPARRELGRRRGPG